MYRGAADAGFTAYVPSSGLMDAVGTLDRGNRVRRPVVDAVVTAVVAGRSDDQGTIKGALTHSASGQTLRAPWAPA